MFRSATFKLTMWYLAIVMAISLAFSAVVYHLAANELASDLSRQSQRIVRRFPVFDNDPFWVQKADASNGTRHILLELAYFNILVFIGAGFASYMLARRTLEPIEQAHEQQKRFTADVSHELRTPITAIKMSSEVALMDKTASATDLRQALTSNIEEADKLDALINSLLRLTRLEAGELQQSFSSVSTTTLAEAALKHVMPIAKVHKISINNNVSKELVQGDQDSLIQLLVILLDNAIKYSRANSGIFLDSQRKGDRIELSVRDEGRGIAPQALEHIFDRFYREDNSRHRQSAEGFGLGLSIAKMIADIHEASITVTSQVGRGTTATISLPANLIKPPHTASPKQPLPKNAIV